MNDSEIFLEAYKQFLDKKNQRCADLIMMISIAAYDTEERITPLYLSLQKAYLQYWDEKAKKHLEEEE